MTKERLRGYRTLLQEKKTLEQQIETIEARAYLKTKIAQKVIICYTKNR